MQEVQQWCNIEGSESQVLSELSSPFNLELICVTKGGAGASLFYKGEIFDHPGFPVKVKDTVGAGDAFLSGLLYSHVQGLTPRQMLNNACALGAFVAGSEGANPPYLIKDIPGFGD